MSLKLKQCSTRLALSVLAAAVLAGCAGSPLRSYDKEMGETLALLNEGKVNGALAKLEENNASSSDKKKEKEGDKKEGDGKDETVLDSTSGKDILYYFEKGELLRLKSEYQPSADAWLQADEIVRVWEDEFRTNPTKALGDVGSYLVSDRVRRYDGQDYEKVFLSTKLMLDHIMLGNADHARIEMKKTFERETMIKNFREQEYEKLKEEGNKHSITLKLEELGGGGYPSGNLDNPEVNSLKNGYQNAFAHYLSGYFFEMKGEPSLSAPGYRNALELRPDSALIREKVEKKGRKPGANEADVLFVLETGQAPAWKSVTIPLPLPINKELVVVPLSFPVVISSGAYTPPSIRVGRQNLPVETLVNVDAMAKRQLKDQMPGIIARTAIRGVLKGAAQYAAQKKGGAVAGLLVGAATVATEQADERSWRTLPGRLSVARAILPVGDNVIEFRTPRGLYRGTITVGGKVNIVPIRVIGDFVYVGQQEATGSVAQLPSSDWAKIEQDESVEVIQKRISEMTKTSSRSGSASDTSKSKKSEGGLLPKKLF